MSATCTRCGGLTKCKCPKDKRIKDLYRKALELACKDLADRTGTSETFLYMMYVRDAENK